MQWAFTSLFSTLSLAILSCLIPVTAKAQVTPDGTTSTTVNQTGNNFAIEQGDRVGDNLFHSFNEFSVPTGGSAGFNNARDIANIFSRVTGSSISNIDGILGANGTANLYLINPNGIIFGENARLNLGGSFFASTADSLLLEGDAEFSAVNPQAAPLLEVSIPIGLSFRDNPGNIVNRSSTQNAEGDFAGLEVLSGNTLALVGGDISFETGNATARGGNIELGGLFQAGIVNINGDGSLSFPEDVAKSDISLSNFADVDVQGTGGGNITINARNLSLKSGEMGESLIRAGILSESDFSEAQSGNIIINVAENITLDNSRIANNVNSGGVGDAGDVSIVAKNLSLNNDASMSSSVSGSGGNSGNINIDVSDAVSISNSNIESNIEFIQGDFNELNRENNTGNIEITTSDLFVVESSRVSTNNENTFSKGGNSGNITITANTIFTNNNSGIDTNITRLLNVNEDIDINQGDILITTDSLSAINGGGIGANIIAVNISDIDDTTNKTIINAGNIKIVASEDILIDNASIRNINEFDNNNQTSTDSGEIEIDSQTLRVINEGRILASPGLSPAQDSGDITINTTELVEVSNLGLITNQVIGFSAVGSAGNLTIKTANLKVSEGGQIAVRSTTEGNAGNLTIDATNSVKIDGITNSGTGDFDGDFDDNLPIESGLFANASGGGSGGELNISTKELTISNSAVINIGNFPTIMGDLSTTDDQIEVSFGVGTGEAGNLNIQANSINLKNGATIFAATQSETGNGANINLQIADALVLENNSLVSAQAFKNANGGNVIIDAGEGFILAFPNGDNDIIANAQQGNGGRININTQAIFGLEERSSTPPNQTNDIDASSEFGLQGDFTLNTPDFDPTTGLLELPASVGDASDQISQNPCQQGIGSEFIVTGKGGLPRNPADSLGSNEVQVGLVEPLSGRGDKKTGRQGEIVSTSKQPSKNPVPEVVPAMGWEFNDKGEVTLTAYSNTDTEIERSSQQTSSTCSASVENR